MILLVTAEVFREIGDLMGEKGDLHLRRPGVAGMSAELSDDVHLLSRSEHNENYFVRGAERRGSIRIQATA